MTPASAAGCVGLRRERGLQRIVGRTRQIGPLQRLVVEALAMVGLTTLKYGEMSKSRGQYSEEWRISRICSTACRLPASVIFGRIG